MNVRPTEPSAATTTNGDRLRYLGRDEIALRGPFSGAVYRVGPNRRLIQTDPADTPTLLRSGVFRRD